MSTSQLAERSLAYAIANRCERELRAALATWNCVQLDVLPISLGFGLLGDQGEPHGVVAGIGGDRPQALLVFLNVKDARVFVHRARDIDVPYGGDEANRTTYLGLSARFGPHHGFGALPPDVARHLLARLILCAVDEANVFAAQIMDVTARFLAERQAVDGALLDMPDVRGRFADHHAWMGIIATSRDRLSSEIAPERIVAFARPTLTRLRRLATDCVQLSGGWGYIARNPIAAFYRDINDLHPILSSWIRLLAPSDNWQSQAPVHGDSEIESGHLQFLESFDDFLRTKVVAEFPGWERQRAVPREVFREYGERGYLRQAAPSSFGGAKDGFARNMLLTEAMMKRDLFGLTVSTMLVANTAVPALGRYASPSLQQRFLPAILAGEVIPCLAVTEASSAGSMVQTLSTTAVREGDSWVINGSKRYITNAPVADLALVLARTSEDFGGAQAFSLFCVPMRSPGVSIAERYEKLGAHCSETGHINIENARVPLDHVVGHVGSGLMYVVDVIVEERVLIGAAAVAYAMYVLNRCVEQIHGQPQRSGLLAWMDEAEMLRTQCWATARRAGGRRPISTEAAMLKYVCADFVKECIDACADALDGAGLMHANLQWLNRARMEARVLSLFTGASGVMRDYYSRRIASGAKLKRI